MNYGRVGGGALSAGRQVYASILVATFSFGVYVVLAGLSLHFLLKRGPDGRRLSRGRRVVLGYTCTMLLVTFAWYYFAARNFEYVLVEQPTTVAGHGGQQFWQARNIVQNVLATVQFFGSDALMLYRAYIICDRHLLFILLASLIYASFLGIGIAINLVSLSSEFGGPLALPPVHALATAFYVLSASLNLLVTSLIAFKLFRHRKMSLTGSRIGVIAILAESAAFYALCSIVFIILFQTGSPAQSWFGAVANCSSFLSQAWIILRIAIGTSFSYSGRTTANRAEFTTDIHLPSRQLHDDGHDSHNNDDAPEDSTNWIMEGDKESVRMRTV